MGDSLRAHGRVALLLVVGVLVATALVTPAGAHVGGSVKHAWTKHFAPLAKKMFYTKAQSDGRYLRKTAKAASAAEADHAADADTVGGKTPADFVASGKMLRSFASPSGGASADLLDMGSNAVVSLGCKNFDNGITNINRVKVSSGGWVVATNENGTTRGFASYSSDPANDDPFFVEIGDAGWVHLNINFGQYVLDVSNNYGIGAGDFCSASLTGFRFVG